MTEIVAELSSNHNGSLNRALELVMQAAGAGADAVKIQVFTPEQMADPESKIEKGPWAGRWALDLYREAQTPRPWVPLIFQTAEAYGINCFASVFHPDDIEFLEMLNCPRYKIASFELTDHDLIRHAAHTGKPLIISTGMATLEEIDQAVAAAAGCPDLTLLKCTSAYPASPADANLAAGKALDGYGFGRILHGAKWGVSDHSLGISVAVAASVMGATMIEKHLTLARGDGGIDAGFSMEPDEFARMVTTCREAVAAIGTVQYGPSPTELAHVALRRPPGGKRMG